MKALLLAVSLMQPFPGGDSVVINGGYVPHQVTSAEIAAETSGSHVHPGVFEDGMQDANYAVAFHAEWCGPCKQMTPVIERLRKEGYAIYEIDVDRDKGIMQRCGFHESALPTVLIFNKGSMIHRYVGVVSIDTLKKHLKTIKAQGITPKTNAEVKAEVQPIPAVLRREPVEAPKPAGRKYKLA